MSERRASEPSLYRFGPRDRRGLLAGLRTSQVLVGAASLAGALGLLRNLGGAVGGVAAFGSIATGAAVACWPLGGRTLEEWLPVLVRFALGALDRRRAASPGGPRRGPPVRVGRVPLPFRDLSVHSLASAAGPIGAVHDRRSRAWTAVLEVQGGEFAVAGEVARDQRVGAWSRALASFATGRDAPHRLQWIERTVPDRGALLARPTASGAPGSDYAAFLDEPSSGVLRHELFLACSVTGARGPERLGIVLAALQRRCVDAGLPVRAALSAAGVASMLRRGLEVVPSDRVVTWPWPHAVRDNWSLVAVDGLVHATFWIAEWPRTEVRADFLLPLLLGAGAVVRRSVAVVMEPLASGVALRGAERARTASASDEDLRRRHGFAVTARGRREREAVERREHELAAGHVGYRFSGYVTVSAESPSELEEACASVEQSGALARLDLRRLYGDQRDALLCVLPTGRGRA